MVLHGSTIVLVASNPDSGRSSHALIAAFTAFVAEQLPFALAPARRALEAALAAAETAADPCTEDAIERLRPLVAQVLRRRLAPDIDGPLLAGTTDLDATPGVSLAARMVGAVDAAVDACDGFLRRAAIVASLSVEERREALRGMIVTRALDNRLKKQFVSGEIRFDERSFQGKGFRSLGQEAIYAACLRLRRGRQFVGARGWRGDVVAPVIRDLGAALAMCPEPDMIRRVLRAQAGKAGPPTNGRDFHWGRPGRGVLPPAAPLAIAPATVAGLAFAMAEEGAGRVAVSLIGEGGSSLGEWHEAINACAARKLPAVFAIENNQTALSTPVPEQSAVRCFADKAVGYGIAGVTIDGTDADEVLAAFTWAAERARAGFGPTLIELVSMRMCGHAHHDDSLYLGEEPVLGWDYPTPTAGGYVDQDAWQHWAARDPIRRYSQRLLDQGLVRADDLERWRSEAEALVEREAQAVCEEPWPPADTVGEGVWGRGAVVSRPPFASEAADDDVVDLPAITPVSPFDAEGETFLAAISRGIGDALDADPRAFIFGQDVGGHYGNPFRLLHPLLAAHGSRIHNAPLAENAILGIAVGAALEGMRPIVEVQFNDFVASGMNQLVNNAAKIRYRWGGQVPMVVRLPWAGLRAAGPFHSQCTEAWFYRTPGLKIVVPSTPEDARALFAAAFADPDPVLFYEHIALYRDPRIKQVLGDDPPAPLPLGQAALRRSGDDLAIVSYGAYVHIALRVAERLAVDDGIETSVLDLRCLAPLDEEALVAVARHCGKMLIVHEDTQRGSVGESLAAIVQRRAFSYLDAPVGVLAALDTPVPYSPPLERSFLISEDEIVQAARALAAY